ncbi:hypothetical protein [Phreatobacter stygius]|uniref:Ppx/GppA phosphatase family protein n=1 Tax=Phreatobacter stygius TaxID=1940610 RepID=UPI001FE254B2|nr:hypothetical protein [Phreatobacter stygius]
MLISGRLADDAVAKALASIRRFRVLCNQLMSASCMCWRPPPVRDAKNGDVFIAECEAICGVPLKLLSGARRPISRRSGVISGTYRLMASSAISAAARSSWSTSRTQDRRRA